MPILLYIGLLIGAQAFQAVPRLHAVAVVAAILPNLAQWASGLIDNALNAAGTRRGAVGMDKLNGAGVVYEGLQTLGEGAVLVGLILGTMVDVHPGEEVPLRGDRLGGRRGAVVHRADPRAPGGVGGQSRRWHLATCSSASSAPRTRSCPARRIRWWSTRRTSSQATSPGPRPAGGSVADERDLGGGRQHDVHPPPRVGALQLPLMAGAVGVLGEQDVAGMQGELLAVARGERQRPASVTTSCRTGAVCQAKAPPPAVSSTVTWAAAIVADTRSALRPELRSRQPISTCEAPSWPVHSRTHRIIGQLLYPRLMSTATVVVTICLAAMFLFSGSIKVFGVQQSLAIRDHLGISPTLWRVIGLLELAGVAGVLAGLAWRPIGVCAAVGLVLLAIGAVVSHVRASDSVAETAPAVVGIGLAVATAVLHST